MPHGDSLQDAASDFCQSQHFLLLDTQLKKNAEGLLSHWAQAVGADPTAFKVKEALLSVAHLDLPLDQRQRFPELLMAFVEHLPRYENHVALDHNRVDAWGIPTLRVSCTYGENERLMSKDAQIEIAGMLEAGGCKDVARDGWNESVPGFAIHEVGTARMGDRPGNSVLNKYCQAWEASNLFVVDASFFPSSAAVNPGLTIAAQALRVADHIKETELGEARLSESEEPRARTIL